MAFAAAGMLGMELMEVLGGAAAVTEAVADVAAAAEVVAMEEGIPLMQTAVGRTVTGEAVQAFGAFSSAARAGSIARAVGASGLVAAGVQGAVAARSFDKAVNKMSDLFKLGKRKRGGTGGSTSLLPARPTRPALPGMPGKKVRKAKPAKRRVVKRKQTKASKRVASKKTKPKKKGPSRTKLTAYENHGLIQRDHVSYFGFQNTGGRDELLRGACESVLKALLRKFRIQIRSPDETLQIAASVPAVDKVLINFRRRIFTDGTDGGEVDSVFDLNAATYNTLVDSLETAFRARSAAGYFPFRMRAYNHVSTADSNEVMRDFKFGDAKLSLAVTRAIKLRNITPNDGNGTDRFALDTNPLQGVMYKFASDTPVVREGLYEGTGIAQWAKFHDKDALRGIAWGPQRADAGDHNGAPDAASDIMGANKVLSSPPKNGKMIWANCVSSTRFELGAGVGVVHKQKYTYSGTLANFLFKYYGDQYKPPKIGVCHWFGLEQKYKQKTKAASGQHASVEHDHVVIEYDVDTVMSGGAAFVAAAKAPRTVLTDIINSAPTS